MNFRDFLRSSRKKLELLRLLGIAFLGFVLVLLLTGYSILKSGYQSFLKSVFSF